MVKHKGFYIINHQDIGVYAIYDESATAFNIVQSINHFNHFENAVRYIDECL